MAKDSGQEMGESSTPEAASGKPLTNGYRPRSPREVMDILHALARVVADQVRAVKDGEAADEAGTPVLWVVPARVNRWQLVGAVSHLFESEDDVPPVRGWLPDLESAVKTVTTTANALGKLRAHRVPIVPDLDICTLWLTYLTAQLTAVSGCSVRIADLPVANKENFETEQTAAKVDRVLVTDVIVPTVLWKRRWRRTRPDRHPGIAQWMVFASDSRVLGAGIEQSGGRG